VLEDALELRAALDEPDIDTLALVDEEDALPCESGGLDADEEGEVEEEELDPLLLIESEDDGEQWTTG
jgi:hypothetical protein